MCDLFILKSKNIHGNKYDYSLVNYVNNKTKVKIICPIHGEFEQIPNGHLSGYGCSKCTNKFKLNTTIFIEKSKNIHGDKYDYSLVNYINQRIKIKIICPIHGEFEQQPNKHLKGCGCKKCSESKGERMIRQYLEDNNIEYLPQHKFNNCKYKNELPFDFYLPDYNICIEYNGAQHYKPVKYWGGIDTLNKIKIRDKIKKKYCLYNNIKLITIRYNENILNKLKLII